MSFTFKDNSRQVEEEVKRKAARALEMMGMTAEKYAAAQCPVKTGRLRDSITHEAQEDAVYIGTNVEYALYVETDDRKAHNNGKAHFLHDSVANHVSEYNAIATSVMKQ